MDVVNGDEKKEDAKWIDLASIPFENKYATPVIYGSDGGIVLSPYGQSHAIKIYNHKENIWVDLLVFKTNRNIHIHTLCVNPNTKALHLYDKKQYKFDVMQKKFIQITTQIENMNIISKAKNLESCFINNEYHIIGYGKHKMQHFSWNESTNTLKQYRFHDHLIIEGYALCCLPKSKKIMLLGGLDITNKPITCYLNCILCYSENNNNNNGFQLSDYTLPKAMSYFGCILTDDEEYIIIFGGQTKGGKLVDTISIMNTITYKWSYSEIKCPHNGKYIAIKSGEYIHLFSDDYREHSKILISCILFGIKTINCNSKWLSLPKTPATQFCQPVATIDGNIILSPFNTSNIYLFNANDCKWSLLITLPQNIQFNHHCISFDNKYNKLYLYDGKYDGYFIQIDINTKCMTDNINIQTNITKTGNNPVSVVLNHILHIIGSECKHLTWNCKLKCFEQHKMEYVTQSIQEEGIIGLQLRNIIIVFGGNKLSIFEKYIDKIWICDEHFLWITSIFKMPKATCGFGYILTKNEKYVIIFGGKTKHGLSDEIYILNTITYKWGKCEIKCPKKAKYYAVFNNVIENIHLFQINTQNHWVISLHNIMPSYLNYEKQIKNKYNNKIINDSSIKILEMELQTAKERILIFEENEQKLINEIKQLKIENGQLKQENEKKLDNTLSSLSKFITSGTMHIKKPLDEWSINYIGSDVVTDPVVTIVSDMITEVLEEDEIMNRQRLPSDTFLLLSDEDFESDMDEQEYEEDMDNVEEINAI